MRSTTHRSGRRTLRNDRGSSELSEFAPVLYIVFLIILMPLLDLVCVFVAGAVQYLATNDLAAKAATQPSYSSALNSMANEAYQFQSNGLAQFVQMVPEGGYTGCGDDLYVLVTDLASGTVTSSAADQPIGQTINTQTNMYEISVKSAYSVGPLVSLAAVPILQNIPGLGKPVTLCFSANRPVEHPGGLQSAANGTVVGSGGPVTPFNRIASNPASAGPATAITWRTPNIFGQIQQAGQTVVNINVVNVLANYGTTVGGQNGGWVNTGITVLPGQKVWLDTQAVGLWNDGVATTDANGLPASVTNPYGQQGTIDGDLPNGMLIGYTGSPPMFPCGHSSVGISGDPRFIPSGDTLLNYSITNSGAISLACNDNQLGDTGSQMVRIIITQ
jgi:hypothetical protein